MKVYLMGAEQGTQARLLKEAGAENIGIAFKSLYKRLPKKKPWLISERLHTTAYVTAGAVQIDDVEMCEAYTAFIEANANEIEAATVWPWDTGNDHLARVRAALASFRMIYPYSRSLPTHHQHASFTDADLGMPSTMSDAIRRRGMGFQNHLLDTAKIDELLTGRWDSAATTSWISPMRFGETIAWDGTRLQRYPARMKDQARRRHRGTFQRAGFDPDRIMEGDPEEITRFTVWSYQRLEDFVSRRKPPTNPFVVIDGGSESDLSTPETGNETPSEAETGLVHVDSTPPAVRNAERTPVARTGGPVSLPGFSFRTKTDLEFGEGGVQQEVERLVAEKGNEPIRQCDTCHVAATCPAFQPTASCAYNFPIEIKTKDQLDAALTSMLEKQMERVAFMMYQEELNGGYADPNTSQELDRVLRMVAQIKEIKEDRATFTMKAEVAGSAGIMASLFGANAKQLRQLDQPVQGSLIDSIIDVEPLDG